MHLAARQTRKPALPIDPPRMDVPYDSGRLGGPDSNTARTRVRACHGALPTGPSCKQFGFRSPRTSRRAKTGNALIRDGRSGAPKHHTSTSLQQDQLRRRLFPACVATGIGVEQPPSRRCSISESVPRAAVSAGSRGLSFHGLCSPSRPSILRDAVRDLTSLRRKASPHTCAPQ